MNRKAKLLIGPVLAMALICAFVATALPRDEGFSFLGGSKPVRLDRSYDKLQDATFVTAVYHVRERLERMVPKIERELGDKIVGKRWSNDSAVEYALKTPGLDLTSDRRLMVSRSGNDWVTVVYNDRQEPSVVQRLVRTLKRPFERDL